MKKIFSARSLIAMLLLASMLLSLLCACTKKDDEKKSPNDSDDCTEHVDNDLNGKCDNCDADVPYTGDITGALLSNAIIKQFEKAQSMKIDVVIDIVRNDESWWLDYDYDTNSSTPTQYTEYLEGNAKLTVTVTKTSDGGVNAKVDAVVKSRYDKEEEFETKEYTYFYLVDGVLYTYDEDFDAYLRSNIEDSVDLEELEDMLAEFTEAVEITEEEKNAVISALGDLAITVFNIKDNKGSISIDAKPIIDDFISYITALDMENDAVSDVLDDALALVSKDLTTKVILTELERVAGLTVNEALAELDAALTESYDTTLQGIYDTIVNNPDFVKVLTDMLKEQYGYSELTEEEIETAVSAVITNIQSIQIADLISQYEIGDIVLYDLITMLIADGENEAEIPTLSAFFDNTETILAMKLGEFEELIEVPIFTTIKESFSSLTVNELNARLDLNFKGILNIDSIDGVFNYDVVTKTPSDVEGKFDISDTDLQVSLNIYDISNDNVEITLPTDKEIYYDLVGEDFYSNDPSYGVLSICNNYDGTIWITIDVTADEYCYIDADYLDASLLKSTTITIDSEDIIVYYDYDEIEHYTSKDLVISIDPANGTYTVTQCPEFTLS